MFVFDLWDGEALRNVRRIDDPVIDVALQLMTHPSDRLHQSMPCSHSSPTDSR